MIHLTFLKQNEDGLAEYFESVVKQTQMKPKKVIGWILNDLLSYLKQHSLTVKERSVSFIATVVRQTDPFLMTIAVSLHCSWLL